ncbi:MAG: class I SAM-dependent methyltransferase [Deltaproteobacteria bacterium]|nr:class I SAM-dependent methyltransferase [Deltaproteobacteria bacterium]
MNDETLRTLNAINRAFYRDSAPAFDVTRDAPWPGWNSLVPLLHQLLHQQEKSPLRILDVGCGNGRFAHFLSHELSDPFDYTGLDTSEALLESARENTPSNTKSNANHSSFQFGPWDFVENPPPDFLAQDRFHFIGVFGVMHHVPSAARRRALVHQLLELTCSGGLLAFAFWQFADEARFSQRILPWEQLPEDFDLEISDLEPGDHLLRWGQEGTAYRYCHHVAPAELEELLSEDLPLELLADYRADGREHRLNRYLILRKTG